MAEASVRRCALVTGAAGGIGAAVSRRLAGDGLHLFLVDMAAERLTTLAHQLGSGTTRAVGHVADATQRAAVEAAVAAAMAAFGRIDVLVNVAGGAGAVPVRDVDLIEEEVWDHVIELNLKSAFLFCRAVVPIMRAQRYGRIVNFSSNAVRGAKGPLTTATARLPYATAKAGLLGFTNQLAKDVAEFGITVNAVLPALVLAEQGTRIRERFDRLDPAVQRQMLDSSPMGRAGTPDDVAEAVAYLASEGASFISGTGLPIDGAA